MTIREIVEEGLHYARTCRSLWLFGFFVGLASVGPNGSGGHHGHGVAAGAGAAAGLLQPFASVAVIAAIIALAILGEFVMRFVSEGALIEGIVRTRRGGTMTTREAFRLGWAHWGVLVRIGLIYFAVMVGSVALLAGACVIALKTLGWLAALLLAIPAVLIAVPWLVTLYLVQAFAARIAVLENRRALDAIRKARLFLHGRLAHGLRLMLATILGTLLIGLVAVMVLLPIVLSLIALTQVLTLPPVLVLGAVVLLPLMAVLTAVLGTYRSSIWTIGYVTQVEA